jgi:hypothetical protein
VNILSEKRFFYEENAIFQENVKNRKMKKDMKKKTDSKQKKFFMQIFFLKNIPSWFKRIFQKSEREGFEPSVRKKIVQRISNQPLSTTQPSLQKAKSPQNCQCRRQKHKEGGVFSSNTEYMCPFCPFWAVRGALF